MTAGAVRRRWRLVAAPALLGAVLWFAGPRDVIVSLGSADARWLAAGLGCALAANLVSALRWRALCAWIGMAVPARWAIVTYFRGVAVNVVLPGAVVGGDVLRATALQRLGQPGVPAALSVVGDRVGGLWMLAALALAALGWGLGTSEWLAAAARWPLLEPLGSPAPLVVLVAALVAAPWGFVVLGRGPLAGRWQALAPLLQHPRAGRHYVAQTALSLAVQALSVAALGCAGSALGVATPAWALAAAALPIFLMATLPVSFGGWGTREAAAAVCLAPFGVAPAQAVTMSVIYGLYPLAQAALALLPADAAGATRRSR